MGKGLRNISLVFQHLLLVLLGAMSAAGCITNEAGISDPVTATLKSFAVEAGNGENTLSWQIESEANVQTVEILWNIAGDVTDADDKITPAGSPYLHQSLTDGTTYFYKLKLTLTDGSTALSDEEYATPIAISIIPVVDGLSVEPGYGQVKLTWDAAAGADQYAVYVATNTNVIESSNIAEVVLDDANCDSNGKCSLIHLCPEGSNLACEEPSLNFFDTYFYRVKAHIPPSDDPTNWGVFSEEVVTTPFMDWDLHEINYSLNSVASNGANIFIAVGRTTFGNIRILRSDDHGVKWDIVDHELAKGMNAVAFFNGLFIAAGADGTIISSSDGGETWSAPIGIPTTETLTAMTIGNSKLIVVGKNGAALTSSDGAVFTTLSLPQLDDFVDITFGDEGYVIAGAYLFLHSIDGTTWTAHETNAKKPIASVAAGDAGFVAYSQDTDDILYYKRSGGRLVQSADGQDWEITHPPNAPQITDVHINGQKANTFHVSLSWQKPNTGVTTAIIINKNSYLSREDSLDPDQEPIISEREELANLGCGMAVCRSDYEAEIEMVPGYFSTIVITLIPSNSRGQGLTSSLFMETDDFETGVTIPDSFRIQTSENSDIDLIHDIAPELGVYDAGFASTFDAETKIYVDLCDRNWLLTFQRSNKCTLTTPSDYGDAYPLVFENSTISFPIIIDHNNFGITGDRVLTYRITNNIGFDFVPDKADSIRVAVVNGGEYPDGIGRITDITYSDNQYLFLDRQGGIIAADVNSYVNENPLQSPFSSYSFYIPEVLRYGFLKALIPNPSVGAPTDFVGVGTMNATAYTDDPTLFTWTSQGSNSSLTLVRNMTASSDFILGVGDDFGLEEKMVMLYNDREALIWPFNLPDDVTIDTSYSDSDPLLEDEIRDKMLTALNGAALGENASADDLFITVGDSYILGSENAVDWDVRHFDQKQIFDIKSDYYSEVVNHIPQSDGFKLLDVEYLNDEFMAVGTTVLTSPNGDTWTNQFPDLFAIATNGSTSVAVGEDGTIRYNTGSGGWQKATSPVTENLNTAIYAMGRFYAAGNNGTFIHSADGISWTTQDIGAGTEELFHFCCGDSPELVVVSSDTLYYSSDGSVWNNYALGLVAAFRIAYAGSQYVTIDNSVNYRTTNDITAAVNWSASAQLQTDYPASESPLTNLVVGNGVFVATLANRAFYYSVNGTTWNPRVVGNDETIVKSFFANGQFNIYSAQPSPTLYRSGSGLSWDEVPITDLTKEQAITLQYVGSVVGNGSILLGVGAKTSTYSSSNGETWAQTDSAKINRFVLTDIAYNQSAGAYIAVGCERDNDLFDLFVETNDMLEEFANVGALAALAYELGRDATFGHYSELALELDPMSVGFSEGNRVGAILRSFDGENWADVDFSDETASGGSYCYSKVSDDGTRTTIASTTGALLTSNNAVTWTPRTIAVNGEPVDFTDKKINEILPVSFTTQDEDGDDIIINRTLVLINKQSQANIGFNQQTAHSYLLEKVDIILEDTISNDVVHSYWQSLMMEPAKQYVRYATGTNEIYMTTDYSNWAYQPVPFQFGLNSLMQADDEQLYGGGTGAIGISE